MSDLKIAIILGSTRPGRNGKAVADWVLDQASTRTGADYELVDLADYPLPHLDEAMPPAMGKYAGEHTRRGRPRSPATTGSFSSVRSTTIPRLAC